ncbi:hypothetical protein [Flavobacterium sp.]|uniref:hypothetical protein n=1 Tax=Flavobacterium sp. TaxID=239 RepID=UPI002608E693|nr:hypothetical protein [Flavobacterium sp.]
MRIVSQRNFLCYFIYESNIDVAKDFFYTNPNEYTIVGETQSADIDVSLNKGQNDLWLVNLK